MQDIGVILAIISLNVVNATKYSVDCMPRLSVTPVHPRPINPSRNLGLVSRKLLILAQDLNRINAYLLWIPAFAGMTEE